jgi:polygalacturonase
MKTSKLIQLLFVLGLNYVLIFNFNAYCNTIDKSRPFTQTANVINVKTFGAKGDGVTNDYDALIKASKAINKSGGGTLIFPKGNYYIKNYHTDQDSSSDILFSNCENLTISGTDAIISVNGNFTRKASYQHANKTYSKTNAIVPLLIYQCKNVIIKGIEFNGNVNKMKRDAGVIEGGGNLIMIMESKNVKISNVNTHHAQKDGIYIGGEKKPSFNVSLDNVISANNARQGMSITNLIGGNITNSKFINTGITDGTYGYHWPAAGVDIEPLKITQNLKTSDITFTNCVFSGNVGGQFDCTSPKTTSNVKLVKCTIKQNLNSNYKYTMILSADSVIVDNCNIDCGTGDVYAKWMNRPGSNVEIKNSIIKSASKGIIAISTGDEDIVNIHDNQLICTAKGKIKSFFPYLTLKNLKFNNNKVVLPTGSITYGRVTSLIQGKNPAVSNIFQTENNKALKSSVSGKGVTLIN